MKHFLFIIMITFVAVSAHAADVGVSISVGQPGFYGSIDIGDFPRPELINPTPIIIGPPPRHVEYEPLYLVVPPGHAKHWSKHCSEYNACGRPVYFVSEKWYNDCYVPEYRARANKGHQKHKNGNQGHGKGHK